MWCSRVVFEIGWIERLLQLFFLSSRLDSCCVEIRSSNQNVIPSTS
jgi:hypothetical protein